MSDRVEYRVERSYLMKIRVAIRHIVLSDLSRKEKLQKIRLILENDITQKVLAVYPIKTFVFAMYLLGIMMRSKNTTGVYYLMKVRELAKKQMFLKKMLKRLGIGK